MADAVSWKILEYIHRVNKTIRSYAGGFGGPSLEATQANSFTTTASTTSSHNHSASDNPHATVIENQQVNSRKIVACVGDSITEGLGASDASIMSYPAILQRHPGFHHYIVNNFGFKGLCATKSTGVVSYWNHKFYRAALDSKQNIVVLQFGTNDARKKYWKEAEFRRDYRDMILSFMNLSTKPSVFVCIPPPIYIVNITTDDDAAFVKTVNQLLPVIIPEIAKAAGAMVINNFNALGGSQLTRPDTIKHQEWPWDLVHPNDLGYLAIAHEVAYEIHTHQHTRGIL
jgi:alpha-L-fucosidase 2